MKKKVAVSACLLGKNCRYDGTNKKESSLEDVLKNCDEVVEFCPEDAILGTPRETINIIDGKVIGSESGKEYTQQIKKYAHDFAKNHPDIDLFIVKSKSPSCALSSAKLFDSQKNLIQRGAGVFTKSVKDLYKNAKFIEKEGK